MTRYERAALRRQARREVEASRRAESRRNDPNARPCPSCGGWDHQRSSSKNCRNHIASRHELADFHRTSIIKTSLRNCCPDVNLQRVIKDAVMQTRTLTYLGSLFVQLLIVSRIQDNLPVPPLTQSFFYNVFGQLVNLGHAAPNWVKDLYQAFSQVGNYESIMQGIAIGSSIITNCALQYAANTVHHITSNFEKRSLQYFFCRFSDSNDEWYQAEVSVKDRKKLAKYCYGKAAQTDYQWPDELESEVQRSSVDSFALSVNMGGPLPITDISLSANAHEYLPWLYQVLQRLEQKVFIKEPTPQQFASRSYVRRKLQEVGPVELQNAL